LHSFIIVLYTFVKGGSRAEISWGCQTLTWTKESQDFVTRFSDSIASPEVSPQSHSFFFGTRRV